MTPNYQCKVSWSRLPSANITKNAQKKNQVKNQENENSNIAPVYFAVTCYLGQIASFRFDFLLGRQLLVGHAAVFFGRKEISLTRIWLTLSQHTHTHTKLGFWPPSQVMVSEWSFAQVLAAFEYDEVYMERI